MEIAIKLAEAREAINEWKAIEKPLADELKKRIKAGEAQDKFEITVSSSFKVSDDKKAMAWATKYYPAAIVIDTTIARKVFVANALTGTMGTVESNGFAFVETEKLTAKKEKGV